MSTGLRAVHTDDMRSRGLLVVSLLLICFVAASLTVHLLRRGSAVENSAPIELRLAESAQGGRDSLSVASGPSRASVRLSRTPSYLPTLVRHATRDSDSGEEEPTTSVQARPSRPAATTADAIAAADIGGDSAQTRASDPTDRKRILDRAARFRDTGISLDQREEEIRRLAKRGDRDAVLVLMAVADQYIYLNRAAVEALGTIRKPEVVAYVRSRLADVNTHDVTLLCECIRSAGNLLGDEAVAEVGTVMRAARKREDGHAGAIREVCIQTLGRLRKSEAVPLLKEELDHMCGQKRLDLAHGSEIVKAYAEIGDKRAADILAGYAGFLEHRLPDEPMPRRYYEEKIREARDTARTLSESTVAQVLARQ